MAGEMRIVSLLNSQICHRRDISHLVSELIGTSTLDVFATGATSNRWIHQRARQLLLRIKILFDQQRQHQSTIAFSQGDQGFNGLVTSKKCGFETTIYILHLGANLEAPEAPAIGKSDYGLCRGLVLETFLSAFRSLSLHREALTYEEEDLLRRKVEELCRCWQEHNPLSPIEDLVFRQLLPATLDEIQDRDGQSALQHVACKRFNRASYESGRTPFCRDPSSLPARLSSIRSARECLCSILGAMSELGWIEGFWTLYDIVGSITHASALQPLGLLSDGHSHAARGKSVEEAAVDLLNRMSYIADSQGGFPTPEILARYYVERLTFLPNPTDISPFDNLAASDRLGRNIKAELVEFKKFLASRDGALKAQYQVHHTTTPDAWIPQETATQEPPISGVPDPAPSFPGNDIPVPEAAQSNNDGIPEYTPVYHPTSPISPLVPRKAVGSPPPPPPQIRDPSRHGSLVLPHDSHPGEQSQVDFSNTMLPGHSSHEQGHMDVPVQTSPSTQEASFPSAARGNWIEHRGYADVPPDATHDRAKSTQYEVGDSNTLGQHPYSSSPIASTSSPISPVHVSPTESQPQFTQFSSSTTPIDTSSHSTPPPAVESSRPIYRSLETTGHPVAVDPSMDLRYFQPLMSPNHDPHAFYSGLEVVQPQRPHQPPPAHLPSPPPSTISSPPRPVPVYPSPPPGSDYPEVLSNLAGASYRRGSTTPSISGSFKFSSGKKPRFFSKLAFSGKPQQEDTLPSIPADIEFRFSSAGSSILLWTRKSCSSVVKLYLSSDNTWGGHRLDLYSATSPGDADGGQISIRLVEGGTQGVAVLMYEGRALKISWFDRLGQKVNHPVGDLNAVPTALAVSRDDSRVALACGGVIQLYSVTHDGLSLAASLPAHSTVSEYPQDNRRIQRLAFSIDSKKLVVATQEFMNSYKRPVYVRIWDCFGEVIRSDKELDPAWLSMGYGDDSGLSGILYGLDASDSKNSRLFLSAAVSKSYASILTLSKDSRNKHLDLKENRIESVAQAPSGQIIFRSGRHKVYSLDIRNGQVQELADFSAERSKLKIQREAMALGMPHAGAALAVWAGGDGGLTLKWMDLGGKISSVQTKDLRDLYFQVGAT